MKKIVCTVTNDLVYDQRMIRICDTLATAGYDVVLVGRQLNRSADLKERSFKQYRWKNRFLAGPLFYLEHNIRIFFYLIRTKPEVVNTIDLDTGFGAYLYSKLTKFEWVVDFHEHFTEVPEVTDRKIVKRIWLKVERLLFKNADKFYAASQSIAEIFQKKYKKKVEVIRNVPFLRSKNVVKPQSEFSESGFLIYQGALNEGRCIELYIKAMHHIDSKLILVGEGDLSETLRQLVKSEGLEDKVVFTGMLTPEELRHVTVKAYMGLNVLENKGLSYYYSLSNKCFDYVQAQIPSISSDFPEYRFLNEQHEVMLLAEPTVESIVENIKELQTNQELYNRLQSNCAAAAEKWNWEEEKTILLAIYE